MSVVPLICRRCYGSGSEQVYALHTQKSLPGGTFYKEKTFISRDQYNELVGKIDNSTQQVFTGVKKCACRG